MYIEELHDRIGDTALFNYRFTTERVEWFAELTMDDNRLHLDKEYAATTRFEKPVVHGMLVASMFSKIFGTQFPGEGAVYSKQRLEFVHPVYHEDFVCAIVKLTEIDGNVAIFETIAEVYQPGGVQPVITGTAEIWLPSMKKKFKHSSERDEEVFELAEELADSFSLVGELLAIAKKWRSKAQMREAANKELEADAKRWQTFNKLWNKVVEDDPSL